MADNVPITAGSGTTIATDDVSDVHFQRVKLVDGTLNSTAAIPGDAANGLDVDVTRLPALVAGTANIGDVDVASIAAGDNNIGNVDVVTLPGVAGAAAHDAAVSGNPVRVGARAASAELSAVASGDAVDLVASLVGKLIVLLGANPENVVRGNPAAITNTTATEVIAAQGSGVKIYVTTVIVTNSHATVGTLVTLQDDAGTPKVLAQGYAAALGGGFVATFQTPDCTGANQKLNAVCGTTGANVYVSVTGYKGV